LCIDSVRWDSFRGAREGDHPQALLGEGERLPPAAAPEVPLPTLWLLGKTGAGKSSIVRALTGEGEVGSGFTPCTRTALAFDFPAETPVLRFLDTRGLGEVGYDPAEDLAEAERGSHMVLVVARLDDPVQGPVARACATCARAGRGCRCWWFIPAPIVPDDTGMLARARSRTQSVMEKAAGGPLPAVTLGLPETAPPQGLDELRDAIAGMLPDWRF
jgi:hypothetical protein